MYERLRDFFVPSAVLDDIFSKEDNIIVLENAWSSLLSDGLSEDETAERIAELVFKETGIDPDQGLEEEEKLLTWNIGGAGSGTTSNSFPL